MKNKEEDSVVSLDDWASDPDRIRLQTAGQIKSEMGRVYRRVLRRKIETTVGTRLIYILQQMLKAVELEQRFAAAAERDEDNQLVFTGLVLIAPDGDERVTREIVQDAQDSRSLSEG